jgi:hypothetical protein
MIRRTRERISARRAGCYGKLTTVTGVSGLAMVDEPPVLLITFKIPPDPAVLRKIVSISLILPAGRVVGTSNAFAAKMFMPWSKKL